jgi:dodecin
MADSVYRVTEVIGVSSESWEAAARTAVEAAAKTVRDLRVAEVIRQDITIENGAITGSGFASGSRSSMNPGSDAEVRAAP